MGSCLDVFFHTRSVRVPIDVQHIYIQVTDPFILVLTQPIQSNHIHVYKPRTSILCYEYESFILAVLERVSTRLSCVDKDTPLET